jgi:hypothetical protein
LLDDAASRTNVIDTPVCGTAKVAHQSRLSPENFMSGFQKSGSFPIDRHIFTYEDFLGSYVTKRPYAKKAVDDAIKLPSALTATAVEVPDGDAHKHN